MRVTGTKIQEEIDVEIPEGTILDFAIALIERDADITDCFLSLDKEEVRTDEEYRHGSTTERFIRIARLEDHAAFQCVEYLKSLKKRLDKKDVTKP